MDLQRTIGRNTPPGPNRGWRGNIWLPPARGLRGAGGDRESARYSALAGGKRLRPALLMEFYRLCGGEPGKACCLLPALWR